MRRAAIVATAMAIPITIAGCASQDNPLKASSYNSSTFPTPSQLSTPLSAATVEHSDDSEHADSYESPPQWDDASKNAAIDVATTAMGIFAEPNLDYETWWSKLSPLLTQQAQQDYAYVVPANIPVHQVTGEGKLVDQESAFVGYIEVPTDVGTYTVIVIRVDGTSPWLVSRFTPPEGVH